MILFRFQIITASCERSLIQFIFDETEKDICFTTV